MVAREQQADCSSGANGNSVLESETEFLTRARLSFERSLSEHRAMVKSKMSRLSFVKVPGRRDFAPFVWLAVFHVLEWSIEKIGKGAHREPSGVRKEIRPLAEEIGLPTRDAKKYDHAVTEEAIEGTLKSLSLEVLRAQGLGLLEQIPAAVTRVLPPGIF